MSLINKLYNERNIDNRSTHRDIGDLMQNDRRMSHVKMLTWSTNPLSKNWLDNTSIVKAINEVSTNDWDMEDNVEVEINLINELF